MKEEERGYERNNNKLVFGVNGERFEVSLSGGTVDPSTTLLRFLHYQTRFKSVKLGCGEGFGRWVWCKTKLPPLISSAKQVVELSREYYPVGEPITKAGAAIQASGEAVFVDDIPSPANCLYGAFIYSTKPLARIKGIEFNSKSLPSGVTALLSYKDIPECGENIGSKFMFGPEPLFADELTRCAGQLVAFVVADTQKNADRAANVAVVNYDMGNLELPILSVEEAIERSSLFEVPTFLYPNQIGDISKGMDEADHKIISAEIKLGSQYYFYMETQTALAVPDEDNCLVVYSSIQCPEYAHATIARCMGIPEHNVRVITRRVGGGFGGKAMKAMLVATACALAAYKLHRPVRIYVNRKTDMIMAGGRHPMKITYSVGYKSNGKITALQLEILIDAGLSPDVSPMMPGTILGALKKYDWGALSFDIKVCKTNLPSRSAMRAPGEVQGSFIAEAVIEHVASTLSMEVDIVRNINLHTYNTLNMFYENSAGESMEYTLPSIWDKLAMSSSFKHRIVTVKEFNRFNIWRKRGISRVPIVYEVLLRQTPGKVSILSDGSVVVEVGGIELGQGLWTKVKQMVAFALSSIQSSGEPPLLLAVSVHCATRAAIKEAQKQLVSWSGLDWSDSTFHLEIPATMPVVKELCGLDCVERDPLDPPLSLTATNRRRDDDDESEKGRRRRIRETDDDDELEIVCEIEEVDEEVKNQILPK
ncbi:hypothetical protein LWI28_022642 [Acer negundo]|uniref:indole-3-acetaldehyde oxidase n=1 Tax=Acer negundo TaxID=4023 RepID=A0AAD5JQB4_ACENE|nr:hypothetical protein LWI28_022642 [Acer negundo]